MNRYKTKKAEAGIGTLILFIAMILVAAIAAGVLISTASSLQSKALFTGSRAKTQVSSSATPIYMYGTDASSGSPRQINRSLTKLKLAPGSDPIKLADAVVQLDTDDSRATLTYDSSINCNLTSTAANSVFNTTANPNRDTHYGVNYLIGATGTGYLQRGDVIEVCMATPTDVGEGESLRFSFVPKVGSPTIIDTKTPDIMLNERVQLFP